MKTKVRICKSRVESIYDGSRHQRLVFQVLDNRYENSPYLEPIFDICFYAFESSKEWGFNEIRCNSSNPDHFIKAAKVAKLIKEKMYWNFLIPEFMNLLNCEEYQNVNSNFLPVKFDQINEYHLIVNGGVYKSLFAYNEMTAREQADKFIAENYRNSIIPEYSVKLIESNISIKPTDLTVNL